MERTFHTSWSNRADNTITFTSTQKQVKHSSNTVKRCEKLKGAEVNGDWHQGNTFTLKYIPSNLILHHYTGVSNFFSYWSHPKWRFSCLTTDKYRTCVGTSSWRQQRDLHSCLVTHISTWLDGLSSRLVLVLPNPYGDAIKTVFHSVAQKFCTECTSCYSPTYRLDLLNIKWRT